jgi:hypothetical protein
MAATASPYGLRPLNLIGGQAFNGGVIREFSRSTNSSSGLFNGDVIQLSSTGQPTPISATPVAMLIPTTPGNSTNATAGIVGVCVGVRYVLPNPIRQQMFGQYLPADAITGGYTDVFIRVMDDPDALFQIQGNNSIGTFSSGTAGSGWRALIGKNAPLGTFTSGSTATGNSGMVLDIGANAGNVVATGDRAMRIVDVVQGTQFDAFPEFIVKFNLGVHSYYNSLGTAL